MLHIIDIKLPRLLRRGLNYKKTFAALAAINILEIGAKAQCCQVNNKYLNIFNSPSRMRDGNSVTKKL
jgi:hypothetical protein